MHAFDVLGDPVRRRILELLTTGEHAAGTIVEAIQREFGISHGAVSQDLKGSTRKWIRATPRGWAPRRVYAVDPAPLRGVDTWLNQFRGFWDTRLNALTRRDCAGQAGAP